MGVKKNILLIGNTTYSNRGCEAIVRGTSFLLKNTFGEDYRIYSVYFHDGSNDLLNEFDDRITHIPIKKKKYSSFEKAIFQFTVKKDLLPAFSIIRSKEFQKALNDTDIVLMVGGDNFSLDYGDPSPFFAMNDYIIEKGKMCVIWGASIGPLSSDSVIEDKAQKSFSKITHIFIRESETAKYLNKIKCNNYSSVTDPGFLLQPQQVKLSDEIETVISNGCIGLNLSPILSKYRSSFAEWIEDTTDIILAINDELKMPVLLIPHVYPHPSGIFGDDLLFLKEVHRRISEKKIGSVFILNDTYSAGQLKWIISRMRFFAGARTHSTIAAFSSCVPTICFGYSIKAEGIVNDIYGNDTWLLKKNDLNKNSIVATFLKMAGSENEIREYLKKRIPVIQESALMAGVKLQEIIGEN